MLNRRRWLEGVGAALLVIGFDPVRRSWITAADASTCPSFAGAPAISGSLHLDAATRDSVSHDKGRLIERVPCAVLRPGSAEDIRRMIEFCRIHGIEVSARGQGHTMFGQGLVSGLLVEMRSLDTIHSIGPDGAVLDAGVVWADAIRAAFAKGYMFPALTSFQGLSVGGTLSMAGISGRIDAGAQVDRARELEVVTGEGRIVQCSMQQDRQLFEAALAGLGQCGIITRAKVDVVPAKPLARQYLLHYTNLAAFFQDYRTLCARGDHDVIFVQWLPNGTTLLPQINAVKFYDLASLPNDAYQMRGLTIPWLLVPHLDLPYLVFIFQIDLLVAALEASMSWSRLVKPWFDVWLPHGKVESYVTPTLASLSLTDVGPGGLILLFPQRRSSLHRPLFRVPDDDGSDLIHLFGILTASLTPAPGPAFATTMLARNRQFYDQARAIGGARYLHCAVEFTPADWSAHYGSEWPAFQQAKARYDPDGILTPGPGIF